MCAAFPHPPATFVASSPARAFRSVAAIPAAAITAAALTAVVAVLAVLTPLPSTRSNGRSRPRSRST